MDKPIAEACFRNQHAIYETLSPYLRNGLLQVFEIGSGTGQHGVYLADRLPNISWQPSDVDELVAGIDQWAQCAKHANVRSPIILDVNQYLEGNEKYDAVFTSNTIHFVSESTATNVIKCAAECLKADGRFFIYGPFKDNGHYTSDGDIRLDTWLKERDPASGIRDRQWVVEQAKNHSMSLKDVHLMPANNFILVFQKDGGED